MGAVMERRAPSAGRVIEAWTSAGMLAGVAIGGGYGALVGGGLGTLVGLEGFVILLGIGLVAGAVIGLFPGYVVGFLDGLLLAWLRPAHRHAPLVAAACTELILLPVQAWLWFVIRSVYVFVVAVPSVAGLCVAARLGWRLPPGGGQPPA
jgi:hypothetical protein